MNIKFKTIARLNLSAVLRDTKGTPEDDSRLLARDILKKIKITSEESEQFELVTPQGIAVNVKAMLAVPELNVDIDEKEARKLVSLIKNGKWGPEDDDWFEPLLTQLKEAVGK